ncbi:hypothetical protein LPJ72_001233, partial [Coemansia sp. Benny D160-2]
MYLQSSKTGTQALRFHTVSRSVAVGKQANLYLSLQQQYSTEVPKSKLLEIERLPFPKFTISNSGMADIVPNPRQFDKNVIDSRLSITPVGLRRLISQFVEANRRKADIEENMEIWRRDVLAAFGNNYSDITLAASMFGKTSRSKTFACALYKVAAEEGYPNAAYHYAILIGTKELKVNGSNALSIKIIKELAELNHVPSIFVLADMKIRSRNTNDAKHAVRLLEKLAEQKNGHACYRLAQIYSGGLGGIERDYKKAIYWYDRLEQVGSSVGHSRVGLMLSKGEGTADGKPDPKGAMKRFEIGAAKGDTASQYELGRIYIEGTIVAKDLDLGLEYARLAAEGGHVLSMLILCSIYMDGAEVPKDYVASRKYLQQAIEHAGSDQAVAQIVKELQSKLDRLDDTPKEKTRSLAVVLLWTSVLCFAEIEKRNFTQPLDHFDSNNKQQFQQTYYVQNQYYRAGGPVLLYSIGERTATDADIEDGWINVLARQTHGLVVLLELRFYGDSMPATTSGGNDTSTSKHESLMFLTVEQMMADMRRFIAYAPLSDIVQYTRDAKDRTEDLPWILVGGSFAGSLMAWTKHQYPDICELVVASSAPVIVKDGYWEFDKMIARRLPCAHNLSLAVRRLDDELDSGDSATFDRIKSRFGLDDVPTIDLFVASLAIQVPSLIQESAGRRTIGKLNSFCNSLAAGSLAQATLLFLKERRLLPRLGCPDGDDRSWLWQQCVELGMWQTAPSSSDHLEYSNRLRSRRLTAEYFRNQCTECFPASKSKWAENQRRSFRAFAQNALEWFSEGSNAENMLFTVGELDPWRYLALDARFPELRASTVIVLPGASHAEDLLGPLDEDDDADSIRRRAIQNARSLIVDA